MASLPRFILLCILIISLIAIIFVAVISFNKKPKTNNNENSSQKSLISCPVNTDDTYYMYCMERRYRQLKSMNHTTT